MSITAPMKAGKSTAINAIVGQELLPSRSDAMTTLPTEVVFKAELNEPNLKLSKETVQVLQKTILALKKKIQELGTERIESEMARYRHLNYLVEKIQNQSPSYLVYEQAIGFKNIREILTILNDVIRLSTIIPEIEVPIGELLGLESPRIETPFWQDQDDLETVKAGNLVIIDTPGANEAGQEQRLETVVRKQLKKSAIVLIIIDFSKIGGTADKKIKAEVETVRRLRSGEKNKKDNLYVLVNCIDKRGKDSRNPEQVKEFVKDEYGIGSSNDNKVFEIAAHWALFSANFFLRGLDKDIDIAKADIKERPDIARDLLGVHWDVLIESLNSESLQALVRSLRIRSGFDEFLKNAIGKIMLLAAPQSMLEALDLSRSYLERIPKDVEFQIKAISQKAEKLQDEIDALQNKLDSLESCRQRIKREIYQKKNKLNDNLTEILNPLKEAAQVSIDDYLEKSLTERWQIFLRGLKGDAKDIFSRKLIDFEPFNRWIKNNSELEFNFNKDQSVEFDNECDAQKFEDLCIKYATERTEKLFDSVRETTEQELKISRQELTKYLNKETTQIVEDARAQLKKGFNIEIPPPPPQEESEVDLSPVETSVKEFNKYGYVPVKETFRPWYFLKLIKKTRNVKIYGVVGNKYTFFLESLIPQINQEITKNIDKIKEDSQKYIEINFERKIDGFFENLEGYLGEYKEFMIRSLDTQKLSEEEQTNIVDELQLLAREANEKISILNTTIKHTQSLLDLPE